MDPKNKVIAICGPTGVGKTEISLEIARRFSGEIINFDSQQFYRELVIGTAKPTLEERQGVPHHLFEALSILEEMNAGKFIELADAIVKEIKKRGNLPLLIGGTGLYLRAFEYGLFKVPTDPEIRRNLKIKAESALEDLYKELLKLDPAYAKKIHSMDKVRIIRALEVIYLTGKPFSEFHRENPFFRKPKRYNILKIGLNLPREKLYTKINLRVLKMLEKGWMDEVKNLYQTYGREIFEKIKAIGYKELFLVLEGQETKERAVEIIQKKSRHYAKRQLTWFKKEKDIQWFSPEELPNIINLIHTFLEAN